MCLTDIFEFSSEADFTTSVADFYATLGNSAGISLISDRFGSRALWSSPLPCSEEQRLAGFATLPSILSGFLLSSSATSWDKVGLRTAQPQVYMDCWWSSFNTSQLLLDSQYVSFGPHKPYLNDSIPMTWLAANYSAVSNEDSFAILPIREDESINTTITMALSRPPSTGSNHSLLLASTWVNFKSDLPENTGTSLGCTIDASWVLGIVTQQPDSPSLLEGYNHDDLPTDLAHFDLENTYNISLSPTWARRALSLGN